MFIGMNYINGDFYPHRPDFSTPIGIFPQSNQEEINLASKLFDWKKVDEVDRIDKVFRLLENIDKKLYFYWVVENSNERLSEKEFRERLRDSIEREDFFSGITVIDQNDFFDIFSKIINGFVNGESLILFPKTYRCTIQHLVSLFDKINIPPGVVNLLHIKG